MNRDITLRNFKALHGIAMVHRSKFVFFGMVSLLIGLSSCHYPREYARCETGDECYEFAIKHPNSKYSMNAYLRSMEAMANADRELADVLWAFVVEVDSASWYRSFEQEFSESPYVVIASKRAQTLEEDSLLNLLYQQPSMAGFESFLNDHPDSRRRREVISCMDDLAYWEAGEKSLDFWQEYLKAYPHGLMKGMAEKGIHDLEIEKLLGDETPGKLAESAPIFMDWMPNGVSLVALSNDCSSDLTIYYQGDAKTYKWLIAPNDTVVELIIPSEYRIVASVNDRDVQKFEGSVDMESGHFHQSMFYIQTTTSWGLELPRPIQLNTKQQEENLTRLVNEELKKNNYAPIEIRNY